MAINWGAMGGWLGDNAGSLINLGVGLYGANQQRQATNDAARMAQNHPYSVNSPFGQVGFGGNTVSVNAMQSPFQQLAGATSVAGMANYASTASNPYNALPSQFRGVAGEADATLQAQQARSYDMGGRFLDQLNRLNPEQAAQERYQLLTDQAQPGIQRATNSLESRLHAQGRLGSTGGAEQFGAFQDSLNQADIGRQMAGADYGMAQMNNMAGLTRGFMDDAANRATQRFGLASSLLGAGDQRRQAAFGNSITANNSYMDTFNPLLQFAQLGVNAGQGSPAAGQIRAQGATDYYNTLGNIAGQVMPAIGQAANQGIQNAMYNSQQVFQPTFNTSNPFGNPGGQMQIPNLQIPPYAVR